MGNFNIAYVSVVSFLLPVCVTFITAVILNRTCYEFLNKGKEKNLARIASIQLWISSIEISAEDICEYYGYAYLIDIRDKDIEIGGGIEPVVTSVVSGGCELTYGVYKLLRFQNVSTLPAVMKQFDFRYGNQVISKRLEKSEEYFIKSNESILFFVKANNSPDTAYIDTPSFSLIFKDLKDEEPYIRIPTVKKLNLKAHKK